jgi:hypothetical protein
MFPWAHAISQKAQGYDTERGGTLPDRACPTLPKRRKTAYGTSGDSVGRRHRHERWSYCPRSQSKSQHRSAVCAKASGPGFRSSFWATCPGPAAGAGPAIACSGRSLVRSPTFLRTPKSVPTKFVIMWSAAIRSSNRKWPPFCITTVRLRTPEFRIVHSCHRT